MNKYRSIEILLQHLVPAVAEGQLAIADRWQDDEQAVGFYKPGAPDLSASVTTHGQPPGWYDVELEFPDLDDNRLAAEPTKADDVRLADVLGLLAVHFDLNNLLPQDSARD
jgi:hypothetical protein